MEIHLELNGSNKVIQYKNNVVKDPLVSISVVTYNHDKYIKQCLDGILMQQTNFEFEILLGEDDSPDRTREICVEYAEKYPDKIRLFLHDRSNVIYINGNPTGRYNFLYNLRHAKGKYIALCEGDDYWIDPLKLQKQVDFLERNKDCSMAFSSCEINNIKDGNKKVKIYSNLKKVDVDQYYSKTYFMATSTLIFRKNILKYYVDWMHKLFAGDFVIRSISLIDGKIGYIDDVTSVYNKGIEGSWSKRKLSNNMLIKEFKDNVRIINFVDKKKGIDKDIKKEKIDSLRKRFYFMKALEIGKINGLVFLLCNYKKTSLLYMSAYTKNMIYKSLALR